MGCVFMPQEEPMFRSNRYLIFLFAVVAFTSLPSAAEAQDKKAKKPRFDVEKFLKRLDTNGNGKVEPGEIKDDRTRGFLKNAGVDPSKPISIKGFAKQVKKKRDQRDNPRSAQQSQGFAVDDDERDEETGSTLGFSVSDEEREPVLKARSRQFSDGAKKLLDWALKNYDKNKDGKIDKNEIKAGRWADPPVSDSDTNKDGSLSRMELLVRYQKREDAKAKKDEGREQRRSSRSRDRGSRERGRNSWKSSPKSKSSSEDKSGNRDVRKGYEDYVGGLFKSYDKNKDGYLDEKEVDGMRRKPGKKADANGDKKISKDELVDSYLEKAGQGKSRNKSRSRDSGKRSSGSRGSSSSSAVGKVRSPLTGKDKNKNGQIEMAEYATTWTVEMVEEFYKIDKNKDGVITKAEWDKK